MLAGLVRNTATATGADPQGVTLTSQDDQIAPGAALQLFKHVVSGSPYAAPGAVCIPVDRDQRRVGDADGRADQRSATRAAELRATGDAAPGETLTCTGSYTVTQADLDAGFVRNTAFATNAGPGGLRLAATNDATATAAQAPALQLLKTITSGSPYAAPGQVLRYQLLATNTGNVTLTNVTISDPKLGALSCTQPRHAAARPGADLHRQLPRDAG